MISFSEDMSNAIAPIVVQNFPNAINPKEVGKGVPVLNETDYLEGINLRKDKWSPDLPSNQVTVVDGGELCMHDSRDVNEAKETS